jgi:hypothetical protein
MSLLEFAMPVAFFSNDSPDSKHIGPVGPAASASRQIVTRIRSERTDPLRRGTGQWRF